MDYTAHHHHQGYDPSAQAVYPQHQGYEPPAQPLQFYDQSAEDYYSYAYSNPQYVNVQPPQDGEREPNPPPHDPNAYFRSLDYCSAAYGVAPEQGGVDAALAVVHQPIVQSSYHNIGTLNGVAYPRITQTHPAPIQSFSASPYSGHGRGLGRVRGCLLHKHQDQTVFTQVGLSQPRPHSNGPSLVPPPVPLTGHAQSAPPPKHMCELCKVECNSLEILNQHNSGKKHMKKLKTFEKSQKMSTFEPDQILVSAIQQLPQESSLPAQHINEVEKRKVEEAKSLWCELCKANCYTLEIFNNHLNGKKHQKKLKTFEKLNKSQIDLQTERVSGPELKAEVPLQPEQESLPSQEVNKESRVAIEKQQVEALGMGSTEQAGAKVKACGSKRKMRGGKVSRSVRSKSPMEPPQPKEAIPLLCELCNIKCESQVVFQSHLVGKKHLLSAKRFLSENEELGREVFQILKYAIQTLHEQNVNASSTSQLDHHHQGLFLGQMDFQSPALEPHLESACVEDIREPSLLRAESDCPTGHLISSETT